MDVSCNALQNLSIPKVTASLQFAFVIQKAGEEVEVVLLGNKCDKEDEREVSKERGEKVSIDYLCI